MANKKTGQVIEKATARNGSAPPDLPAKMDVLPPSVNSGLVKGPKKFETITDVIREQQRLYKMVFDAEIALSDLTKLMYSLQQIIQGLKAKAEMDTLEDAYIKQWHGVRFIAPPGVVPPDPVEAVIVGEAMRDE